VSLVVGALVVTAFAVNSPVAAGESSGGNEEPVAVVTEISGDAAPMVEPLEDVDDSAVSGDVAPMVEPLEDVDE
jgi:ABC-type cobalt transport system substrate-binding protein